MIYTGFYFWFIKRITELLHIKIMILGVKVPLCWLAHTSCAPWVQYVGYHVSRWQRESEGGFSALIIRWHFTQHSLWIRAPLFVLLQLQFASFFPLAFLCITLILFVHLSLLTEWTQQRKTCNLAICTFWASREVETEHTSTYCVNPAWLSAACTLQQRERGAWRRLCTLKIHPGFAENLMLLL